MAIERTGRSLTEFRRCLARRVTGWSGDSLWHGKQAPGLCGLLLAVALLVAAPGGAAAQSTPALAATPASQETSAIAPTALPKKTVLVLLPFQPDMPVSMRTLQTLQEEFGRVDDLALTVYYEFLDSNRFTDSAYQQQLFELYATKYGDKSIDLVMIETETTLNTWLQQRDKIAPNAPVVFFDTLAQSFAAWSLPPDVTGVGGALDYTKSIAWILQARPAVKEVALVYGVGPVDLAPDNIRPVQAFVQAMGQQVRITDLSNLPLDEIKRQVAALSPSAVVLYHPMFEDAAGDNYGPLAVLRELMTVAPVPVLGGFEQFIGTGAIGGYMYSLKHQIQLATQMGLRILRGAAVSTIPQLTDQGGPFIFDHLALQRFEIPLDALPPESIVENRQVSFWELYQPQLIAIGMGFAVLLLLALFLAASNRQLKKARLALRDLNASLETQVEERTAQLSAANVTLSAEISERSRVEAALRENAARLHSYLALPLSGIAITSLEKGWMEVNAGLIAMLGYSPLELAGLTWADLTHPDDLAADEAQFDRVLAGEIETYALEKRFIRKSGEIIWTDLSVGCVRKPDRSVEYMIAVLHDISERKRAEEALHETNAYLENLINYANAPIIVWDPQFCITRFNHAFEDLSGRTEAEMLGQSLDFLFPPALREQSMAQIRQTLSGQRWEVVEIIIQHRDGTERVVLWNSATLFAADGQTPLATIAQGQDITERKRAEEALHEINAYLENLINYANAPIIVWDPLFRITRFNHAFELLSGRTEAEVLGQPLGFLFPPALREQSMAQIRQTLSGQRWEVVEIVIQHRSGSQRVVLWNSATLFAPDGYTPLATIAQGQDITERKRAEEELARAKDAAEAANRAKSEFLANMSHELRTPLNAILGFSELLARDLKLTADQRENLAIINRSGEHLLGLINDVLDMAKIEAGRVTLQEHDFDLHRLLNGLGEIFQLRARVKQLQLRVTHDPAMPRFICADESKLRQVLINLLGNALKFTSAGSVTLSVQAAAAEATGAGCHLFFAVQDTGPGIQPDVMATIFEPFVQVKGGAQVESGTGLGLPISRQFARLMGGELTVTSAGVPGQGSCFTLEMPVRVVTESHQSGASPLARPQAIGLEPGQPAYRLLVVDDRDEGCKLLADLLTQLGFTVRTAASGVEALQVWEEWAPHLIWMDMRMPVMDGHEATRRIKATPQGLATVVVALTASVFAEQRASVLEDGCDDFVGKPFRQEEIVDCLVRHLGVRMVYADGAPADESSFVASANPLLLDSAGLPSGWIEHVQRAAQAADAAHLLKLAAAVGAAHPAVEAALQVWVEEYDYDAILAAMRARPENRGQR